MKLKAEEKARKAAKKAAEKAKKASERECAKCDKHSKASAPKSASEKRKLPSSPSPEEMSEVPRKKTRVGQYTSETIDTNVCCTCFRTYDEDVLEGTGADSIACACGRWLHEDCAEDCVQDDSGNDHFCPLCIDLLTV